MYETKEKIGVIKELSGDISIKVFDLNICIFFTVKQLPVTSKSYQNQIKSAFLGKTGFSYRKIELISRKTELMWEKSIFSEKNWVHRRKPSLCEKSWVSLSDELGFFRNRKIFCWSVTISENQSFLRSFSMSRILLSPDVSREFR